MTPEGSNIPVYHRPLRFLLGFARRAVFERSRGEKGIINHTLSSSSPLIDHRAILLLYEALHCL